MSDYYRDGYVNGYAAALCAVRRRLRMGVGWQRAVDAVRSYWLRVLVVWADDGGEFPPSIEGETGGGAYGNKT